MAAGIEDYYALRQCPEWTKIVGGPDDGKSIRNDVYAAFLLRPLLLHFPCYMNGSTLLIFADLPLLAAAGCLGIYVIPPRLNSDDCTRTFYKPSLSLSHNRWFLPAPLTTYPNP